MRISLAKENGCSTEDCDFYWIHHNNQVFKADSRDLVTASYTFTIVRCPYVRLVSVYLDKFVERDVVAWAYVDRHHRHYF